MAFVPLFEYCPELAKRETWTITQRHDQPNLPADSYGLLELYCDEPGCDCRRVMFHVVSKRHERPEALIGWGWESLDFYRNWFTGGTEREIRAMKGPDLEPFFQQGPHSEALLDLLKRLLLTDPAYIECIKRHYEAFRRAIDG